MTNREVRNQYRDTSVHFERSRSQIEAILRKNRIEDIQHTVGFYPAKGVHAIMILFSAEDEVQHRKYPIRILIPLKHTPDQAMHYHKDLNQAYRALFWYLKSKFEAIAFGFEFLSEFMPHIVVVNPQGALSTMAEEFIPRLQALPADGSGSVSPPKLEDLTERFEEGGRL